MNYKKANYPIERIRLMDDYNAVDETAMRDNNTSSFNFRFISHSTKVSKHGLVQQLILIHFTIHLF